jgi:Ti type entry exclusion protein TrbK
LKFPIVIIIAVTLVFAIGGSVYMVVVDLNHRAEEREQRASDFFSVEDDYPTEGGQQMEPRF